MSVAEFVGDEFSAACYRLCGVEAHVAERSNALSLIDQACERAPLVLVASSTLKYIPGERVDELLSGVQPAVLVVPDVRGLTEVPDIASRINKQLGLIE